MGWKLGIIKKLFNLIFLTAIISFCFLSHSFAEVVDGIAILPLDTAVDGTSYSIYPGTPRLISTDVANQLKLKTNSKILDANDSEMLIKAAGLNSKYKKLAMDYKNTYTVNFNDFKEVSSALGVDKILLIAGGFDTQNMKFKHKWLARLSFPDSEEVIPIYDLNIHMILVDASERAVVWEKGFSEEFNGNDFALPAKNFAENAGSVAQIKNFSFKLSSIATNSMLTKIKAPALNVDGEIISPEVNAVYKETPTDKYMEKNQPVKNVANIVKKKTIKCKNWMTKTFSE